MLDDRCSGFIGPVVAAEIEILLQGQGYQIGVLLPSTIEHRPSNIDHRIVSSHGEILHQNSLVAQENLCFIYLECAREGKGVVFDI